MIWNDILDIGDDLLFVTQVLKICLNDYVAELFL